MKRIFLLLLCILPMFSACVKTTTVVNIPDKGRFTVEGESGTEFVLSYDGEYEEYVFTKPEAISSLVATTQNGAQYKLTYKGIDVEFSAFSIQEATDFSAALKLLKACGKAKNGALFAEAEGMYATYKEEQSFTKIEFFNGTKKRIYKITTEA